MSGRRALALRSFKEEAVLARVVRSAPTMSSHSIIKQANERIWSYPMPALMAADVPCCWSFCRCCPRSYSLIIEHEQERAGTYMARQPHDPLPTVHKDHDSKATEHHHQGNSIEENTRERAWIRQNPSASQREQQIPLQKQHASTVRSTTHHYHTQESAMPTGAMYKTTYFHHFHHIGWVLD